MQKGVLVHLLFAIPLIIGVRIVLMVIINSIFHLVLLMVNKVLVIILLILLHFHKEVDTNYHAGDFPQILLINRYKDNSRGRAPRTHTRVDHNSVMRTS
jgi:type IV secretory pathway VirB3-like protein